MERAAASPPAAPGPLARIGEAIASRPKISALLLGAVSATGFEPLHLWPLALAMLAVLFVLLEQAGGWRRAALIGWLFGVGHFTVGNGWIATAFTYQANMPAILGWAAVPLLSLYLAVYPALAAGTAKWIAGRGGWPMALALAGTWAIGEWLRSWVFTGYPWNPLAMLVLGDFDHPGMAAIVPYTGTYALSGMVLFLAAALALLVRERNLAATLLAAALLGIGMYLPARAPQEGSLPVTLVQPDIRQEVLNEPEHYENNFLKTARLSVPRDPGETRLVLWPESGLPDYLREGYPARYYNATTAGADPLFARMRVARLIGPGSMLLSGTTELEIEDGRAVGAYNSVTALDGSGAIRGSYAKARLVPYGEYLALRWLLEPLGASRLVPGAIDFLPGPGPQTLDLGDWGRAGIQVCYEIIFSGRVAEDGNRPDYIFNPSNDGWFGSWGPPQHLAQARLRAIEEGLPVLRSTTTGISAIIDARGVVREYAPMHQARRIEAKVPPAAAPTPFSRLGNMLALGWAIIFLALAAVAKRRSGR